MTHDCSICIWSSKPLILYHWNRLENMQEEPQDSPNSNFMSVLISIGLYKKNTCVIIIESYNVNEVAQWSGASDNVHEFNKSFMLLCFPLKIKWIYIHFIAVHHNLFFKFHNIVDFGPWSIIVIVMPLFLIILIGRFYM